MSQVRDLRAARDEGVVPGATLATLHHLSPNSLIIKSALPSVAPGELYKIEQSSVVPSVPDTVYLSTKLRQVWMVLHFARVQGKQNVPLLIAFHGSTESGPIFRSRTTAGLTISWRLISSRKATSYLAKMENIDHIGFTKSIIQYFSKNWLTCPQRTLIAGYSHGGHMCYCLALELSSRYIAEVAIHFPTLRTEDNFDFATRKKPDLRVLAKQGRIMNLAACFRSQDGTIWIGHNRGMHEPTSSNIQIKWRALATPSSENGQVEKYEDAFVRAPLKCNKLTDDSAQSSSYHVLLNLESKDTASIRRCLSPPYTLCDRSRSHVSTMKNAKTCKINDYSAMSCLCAPLCSITFTTSTKHYSRPSSQGHRLTFTPSIRKDFSPPSIPLVTDHNYILPSVNNVKTCNTNLLGHPPHRPIVRLKLFSRIVPLLHRGAQVWVSFFLNLTLYHPLVAQLLTGHYPSSSA
ncbi:hypothetical protein MJO28_003524 [Puccinia striiformis f. sp. tritici]|uniref:Uncharacterized protein n=1 Tax=Puccinia striiformis f. sp. tritici TaxID=168172 RepID=A0ACC0ENP3_9BASI|nr:hypothetical protein MJO28_003524 [Puccinia striiformis f. sp. tritici]